MKALQKLFLAVTTIILLSAFTAPEGDHVGKWKGKDKGDIGYLTLTSDGFATFHFNGQLLGGKSYNHKGVNAAMKYTVNYGTSPANIDFVIVDNKNNKELGRLKGIINMKSRNEMQMALAFGNGIPRPTNFSKDAIVFYRDVK